MLQSPEFSVSLANVLQAVTSAALIAGARLLWDVRDRITSIETSLNDPELGVKPTLTSLRKSRHNDGNTLQAHDTRLDGHDREIERIAQQLDRDPHGDRRAVTAEPYDRRSPA